MEHRRPDVILLMGGAVLVLEIKGKGRMDLADVDQASGYARDLRAYHRECEDRPVHPVLVLMRGSGRMGEMAGVEVIGPDALDNLVGDLRSLPLRPTYHSALFSTQRHTDLFRRSWKPLESSWRRASFAASSGRTPKPGRHSST